MKLLIGFILGITVSAYAAEYNESNTGSGRWFMASSPFVLAGGKTADGRLLAIKMDDDGNILCHEKVQQ